MGDNRNVTDIVPIGIAQQLAKEVIDNPEGIYDVIQRGEKWLKELREKARQELIKRADANLDVTPFETENYTVNCTRTKPSLLPDVIYATFMAKKLDPKLVVFPKPIEYEALPTARDSLKVLLASKILTQTEYDSMFDKIGYVVKVKPKHGSGE